MSNYSTPKKPWLPVTKTKRNQEIYKKFMSGGHSSRQLGHEYGITHTRVMQIVNQEWDREQKQKEANRGK
jgi:Mor family transcriptional regulator